MPLVRMLYRVPAASQNSEDDIVNVWGFNLQQANEAGTINCRTAVLAFYERMFQLFTVAQDWDQPELKWYDMSQPPPRAPFQIDYPLLPSQPTNQRGMNELAMCLSFQGTQISGIPQRRRRGRLYMGPIDPQIINPADGLYSSGSLSVAYNAAQTLWLDHDAASDWSWMILSETPSLNGVYVDNGWIDNAPDIQRRRGYDPTQRELFGNPVLGLNRAARRAARDNGTEAVTEGT